MDDEGLTSQLNEVMGEAIYASTVAEAAFHMATSNISKAQVFEMVDRVILAFERSHALVSARSIAVEHARRRLETLREIVEKRPWV